MALMVAALKTREGVTEDGAAAGVLPRGSES